MSIDLDRLEQRIIGVLIEKELTVPETYPLTLNSLLAGCNQKSNRDPQMNVEEYEIEGALRSLMDKGWVRRQERDGARAFRYTHETRDQLGVEKPDLAILSELLCRGPQAPGALKVRAARMYEMADPQVVEQRLEALAARPIPYVQRLARQPREQQPRWTHLLGASDAFAEPASQAPETTGRVAAPRPVASAEPPSEWSERLELLEEAIVELRDRLERLERLSR